MKLDILIQLFSNVPIVLNFYRSLLNLSHLSHSNVLQLSVDGVNVNLDVLKQCHQYRVEKKYSMIVNIGSCGLHILDEALQYGFKQLSWDIDKILKAMWQTNIPPITIQAIYIYRERERERERERGCDTLPLRFCKTRWIQHESVVERAIRLWRNIVQIIKYWHSLSKSKRPQNNKSYVLVSFCLGPLVVAKLHFF